MPFSAPLLHHIRGLMDTVWKELHSNYQEQNWIGKPSIFAETAIQYFPKNGKILELGAGHGQDSFFFARHGYDVLSSDIETSSLNLNFTKQSAAIQDKVEILQLDLKKTLPFQDQSLDVVYAHLSLHYFDTQTTWFIINEIRRTLKPEGIFAFLANSISDPEYSTGNSLEEDFFLIDKVTKRYFSIASTRKFTQDFQISLLDNLGKTYKDEAKGVSNLIRFIGNKTSKRNYAMAIPFVGAIIERVNKGVVEVLIQTRWKPHTDSVYTGTFEFPVGTLDKPYESVYKALAREIDEECGLKLKNIIGDSTTAIVESSKADAVFGFRPFCCTQQLKNGKPWIGFIFICEVENTEPKLCSDESKDIKWVKASEIKQVFTQSPEKLFTLELPAWEYYFKEKNF